MGARQLKRDVEALIGDYVGQKIRENSFDPKGKATSTVLDELAHYDLAISVALWWLDKEEEKDVLDIILGGTRYPNRLEREAMILSSFAGIIMVNLYKLTVPCCVYSQATIVCPFSLSYHPFAMLSSYKAVDHSKKHSECRHNNSHCAWFVTLYI
uniref:Uncharacterized protein n=1 Tax=Echeneis naucrates TaxID=173247 RepID=A0A665WG66_ECHNA